MDDISISQLFRAKAEECPSTAADAIGEFEAVTMVGAEEAASTSRSSEYYSARCEEMMRSRGHFSDEVELEIEFSKPHWSEVSRLEVEPQSAEEEELNQENRELLQQLREEHPRLFYGGLDGFALGRVIAKGGQAEIYEVVDYPLTLMKVFARGTSLQALRQTWSLPVLNEDVRQCVNYAGMLANGRFAFLMERCWGDLRKLIDQAMQAKNAGGARHPPFPYSGLGNLSSVHFVRAIARHMMSLHEKGVTHRDLKASNILLRKNFKDLTGDLIIHAIVVADFECSIGVLGTGYWRAPEILAALGKQESFTHEQWKEADVYSFGMTCFEIVTGRIPFDGELGHTGADRQLVIEGRRPLLPNDLDVRVKELITKCWAPNSSLRPTFVEIVDTVERIVTCAKCV